MGNIIIIILVISVLILLTGLFCFILGFRVIGVAAYSCAACWQSSIGNVVRGSCFAIITSLGMKGCFIAMIIIGIIVLVIIGIDFMINSEWFQNVIEWFQNVIEWFQNIFDCIIKWFSKTHSKFLTL